MKFSIPRKSTASIRNGAAIGKVMDQKVRHAGAINLGRFVDVIGNGSQAGQADQHHVWSPHPGIHNDDRPRRQLHLADHLEGGRISPGDE